MQGATGPTGPQGIQGPRGEQGVQGKQGEPGPAGAAGTPGLKGDKGDKGEPGIQGPKGDKGETGPAGPQGERGPQGIQGPTGAQGPKGNDGADGRSFVIQDVYSTLAALRNAIPNGDEYAYLVSADKNVYIWSELETDWKSLGQLQGPEGAQGPVGAQGVQGPSGTMTIKQVITGEPGSTASVINEGSTENAELVITIPKGDKGDKGDTGTQGPKGEKGDKGDTGATGAAGPQGIQGVQGIQGETGPQGPQGLQGAAGRDGISAYQSAVNGGYTGTESDFNKLLAISPSQSQQDIWTGKVSSVNGKTGQSITLTAADVGASKQIVSEDGTVYEWGIDAGGLYIMEVQK